MQGNARSLATLLSLAIPVTAWGNDCSNRSKGVVYFYYPVAVACMPVTYNCGPIPYAPYYAVQTQQPPLANQAPAPGLTAAPRRTYAQPTAAPPSTTAAPSTDAVAPTKSASPPPPRTPAVTDTGSYFDTYVRALHNSERREGSRPTAEFWNLTQHDLTIKVDGQRHIVAKQKSLLVEVPRQFIWQIEGRDPQKEQIATGELALELVIRR